MTCRICREPVPFASRPFCKDVLLCNHRARLRLDMSPRLCALWKKRDAERMYPRRRR